MVPKNLMLGAGTMYIDGQPIGEIHEISFEEESELDILGRTEHPLIVQTPSEITLTCEIPGSLAAQLADIERKWFALKQWAVICKCYPNKRVVHLANHHHDPIIRKKNAKRIMRHFIENRIREV